MSGANQGAAKAQRISLPNSKSRDSILEFADSQRVECLKKNTREQKSELGQFLTPSPVARLMAGMFESFPEHLTILDPGAGVGSLAAAIFDELESRNHRPQAIHVDSFEVDDSLHSRLSSTHSAVREWCEQRQIKFTGRIFKSDFVETAVNSLKPRFDKTQVLPRYNLAILNPPYNKINTDSPERRLLSSVGIETSNIYAGFVALSLLLLEDEAELVAITPRSFCNGPYFKPFRKFILGSSQLKQIHSFISRDKAFSDESVLQENIVFRLQKRRLSLAQLEKTTVRLSVSDSADESPIERQRAFNSIVDTSHDQLFIHIPVSDEAAAASEFVSRQPASLEDLGLECSTGRVVDFRAKKLLSEEPTTNSVPLIYPTHLRHQGVEWPKIGSRKPNALLHSPDADSLLIQEGTYVLVKRFTSKEERRRVVACLLESTRLKPGPVAIENHVNYFHANGAGLDLAIAKGLCLFLNSTLVDEYFRQFSGHTQVNATDLRFLSYPSQEQLTKASTAFRFEMSQLEIDEVAKRYFGRT